MRAVQHILPILFIAGMCTCTIREQKPTRVEPIRCEVLTVQHVVAGSQRTYSATVKEQAHIPLSLSVGGNIVSLPVQPNQHVKKGDLLLRVDDTAAQQMVASAQAAVQQADDALRRTTPLHAKGLITDIQMVELRTKKEQAEAYLRTARQQESLSSLIAPADGIVTYSDLHVGQHITPAVTLMTMLDISGFTIEIHVPEAEMQTIHPGDSGMLLILSLQQQALPVKITRKGVQANPLTHTYPVEGLLVSPAEGVLPGMVGTLRLMESHTPVIVIPTDCVSLLPDGAAVWIENAYGRAERRHVTLGSYRADGVEVLTGLQNGDKVVTAGYQKLYHDAEITH